MLKTFVFHFDENDTVDKDFDTLLMGYLNKLLSEGWKTITNVITFDKYESVKMGKNMYKKCLVMKKECEQ